MPAEASALNRSHWTPLPEYVHDLVAESTNSILLETSRFDSDNQRSYLFLNPCKILTANTLDEIPQLFAQLEEAQKNGFHVAGYFSYECGYHFDRFAEYRPRAEELPLAWFGVYEQPCIFNHDRGCFEGAAPFHTAQPDRQIAEGDCVKEVALSISAERYTDAILTIKEYIAAGDTYQVNFTDAVEFETQASALLRYESLFKEQTVAYGAWLNLAEKQILSFSPELFFRIDEQRITTRPMKGTIPRGLDLSEDAQATERLHNDEKNRSEHVMIVDLLRNDLGRICTMGSVRVENIFSIERYQTLLQMTSAISGALRPNVSYYEIFRSLFPCGSVTGAPKIRTMQIIRELEQRPRGIYTGAIGYLAPNGNSAFNVAIRTLVMQEGHVRMGVGGGIVADSEPEAEHSECLLKASFLTHRYPDFQLIETLRWEGNFHFLEMHLERMESSADYFDFSFFREEIHRQLMQHSESFAAGKIYRVRLLLCVAGSLTVEAKEFLPGHPTGLIRLSEKHTHSTDVFLRHKTTERSLYVREYAEALAKGCDEVIFTNERGEVTEGAVSNLLIEQDGILLTPPLSCGVLPGIHRRYLLETNANAKEKILTLADLHSADAIYICNSLRGMRRVWLIEGNE
jgi:para-aminobenzoate synthetase/4-amino-4-deoxychorismate lyase